MYHFLCVIIPLRARKGLNILIALVPCELLFNIGLAPVTSSVRVSIKYYGDKDASAHVYVYFIVIA